MEKGDGVTLTMLRHLVSEDKCDGACCHGEILKYDPVEERIYLLLKDKELTEVSLDAVYKCVVNHKSKEEQLTGRVRERYLSESGKVLEVDVLDGVYELGEE